MLLRLRYKRKAAAAAADVGVVAETAEAPEDGAGGGPLLPPDLLMAAAAAAPCRMALDEELGVTADDVDFEELLTLINGVLPVERPLVDNVKEIAPLFADEPPELAIVQPPTAKTPADCVEQLQNGKLACDRLAQGR